MARQFRTFAENGRDRRIPFTIFGWAGVVGLAMSTQFLAQPFVWRNWPIEDIAAGWSRVAADRLVGAFPVAALVVLATRVNVKEGAMRVGLLATAAVAGAVVGEVSRHLLDPFAVRPDAWAMTGRIVHWALIGATGVGILTCWRFQAGAATAIADTRAADARARHLLVVSELDALQRQIEPHFLFNTLATVRRFGQTAPAEARMLMDRLFDYVWKIFEVSQDRESTLGSELDLILAYLDVCSVRMGARLTVVNDIPPSFRSFEFPPLMLGTLVENAIRHGLAPLREGGTITLSARQVAGRLEVSVSDDGAGLTGDGGVGLGLANLAERLRLAYGDTASLRLEAREPRGARAVLRLPGSRRATHSSSP